MVIAGASDMADDVVTTSEAGEPGRVAVNLEWLIEQVDEFLDDRIRFDAGDGMAAGAVRISSPDNPNLRQHARLDPLARRQD